jgi:hypothetical protein
LSQYPEHFITNISFRVVDAVFLVVNSRLRNSGNGFVDSIVLAIFYVSSFTLGGEDAVAQEEGEQGGEDTSNDNHPDHEGSCNLFGVGSSKDFAAFLSLLSQLSVVSWFRSESVEGKFGDLCAAGGVVPSLVLSVLVEQIGIQALVPRVWFLVVATLENFVLSLARWFGNVQSEVACLVDLGSSNCDGCIEVVDGR